MKYFIISDIHGSAFYLKKALDAFESLKADYLVICGDVLYHGPRNPLPEGYAPAEVAGLLNEHSHKIIAVRGNCDSEVDQMVLNFHLMNDYQWLLMPNFKIFLTHGHLYHALALPKLKAGDVLIHGHNHVPKIQSVDGIQVIGLPSLSIPKEGSKRGYAVIENTTFECFSLEGEKIFSHQFENND